MQNEEVMKRLNSITLDIQTIRSRTAEDTRPTYPRILEILDVLQKMVEVQSEIIQLASNE